MHSGSEPIRTLIADDQPDVLAALGLLLKSEGYQTEEASSPAAVLDALRQRDFDVVLMDLNYARDTTSGQEGLDLISRIQEMDNTLPVVAMTAWGSIELAVEAMRRGVCDFVLKPWDNRRLLETLKKQIEQRTARSDARTPRRLVSELKDAREIQHDLLPGSVREIPGFKVAQSWRPAREVGGDYYDVIRLGSQTAVCIGDVAGKGMPAALLMSNVQAVVKAYAAEGVEPHELCDKVNQFICANVGHQRFVTFFYALLESETRRLVYANAGHAAPILVPASARGREDFSYLSDGGAVLGIFDDWKYEQSEVRLSSGDRLLLFTDGITEARNAKGDEFGEERLAELLFQFKHLDVQQLNSLILDAVTGFCRGEFHDDSTLVLLAAE
jgi:sigma-B regulation protein RsbU (phosphoserine phosphatase)